jgi:hypothetical protein
MRILMGELSSVTEQVLSSRVDDCSGNCETSEHDV